MIVQAKHHLYLQQEMGNIQYLKELKGQVGKIKSNGDTFYNKHGLVEKYSMKNGIDPNIMTQVE